MLKICFNGLKRPKISAVVFDINIFIFKIILRQVIYYPEKILVILGLVIIFENFSLF